MGKRPKRERQAAQVSPVVRQPSFFFRGRAICSTPFSVVIDTKYAVQNVAVSILDGAIIQAEIPTHWNESKKSAGKHLRGHVETYRHGRYRMKNGPL
jgi:hypothetical protein